MVKLRVNQQDMYHFEPCINTVHVKTVLTGKLPALLTQHKFIVANRAWLSCLRISTTVGGSSNAIPASALVTVKTGMLSIISCGVSVVASEVSAEIGRLDRNCCVGLVIDEPWCNSLQRVTAQDSAWSQYLKKSTKGNSVALTGVPCLTH